MKPKEIKEEAGRILKDFSKIIDRNEEISIAEMTFILAIATKTILRSISVTIGQDARMINAIFLEQFHDWKVQDPDDLPND